MVFSHAIEYTCIYKLKVSVLSLEFNLILFQMRMSVVAPHDRVMIMLNVQTSEALSIVPATLATEEMDIITVAVSYFYIDDN